MITDMSRDKTSKNIGSEQWFRLAIERVHGAEFRNGGDREDQATAMLLYALAAFRRCRAVHRALGCCL